ncbi:hypothetical protein NDU88_000716 [Pleurodeles waltl]|uniref:Uncharacterized protein n=1 Tax=Pleurodeles waltl TaxID=8319 RepID=A0AAV7LYW1_PLEWA|nr:hypothetical protein NDU88_000716 [Pleurodeles waltl]
MVLENKIKDFKNLTVDDDLVDDIIDDIYHDDSNFLNGSIAFDNVLVSIIVDCIPAASQRSVRRPRNLRRYRR